jgi:small subunit ribosomal protein S21
MIIIDVTKEKSIYAALRTYKQKVQKTRQLQDLKNRKEYIKPSVEKRDSKLRAIHTEKIKNGLK